MDLDCILGAAMDGGHKESRDIGADRDQAQVDRGKTAANLFKIDRVVASVSNKIELFSTLQRLDDIAIPEGLIFIPEGSPRKVLRRYCRNSVPIDFNTLPPIELNPGADLPSLEPGT